MNVKRHFTGFLLLLVTGIQPLSAATIEYALSNVAGNTWEYSYFINNDIADPVIDEFTVYFDANLYANLSLVAAPPVPGWDALVVQPNVFLGNDGFYDAMALAGGITPGGSLDGFSVRFDYLGSGAPGAQMFDIVDPGFYIQPLQTGMTSPVPLPAALWLLVSGCFGLLVVGRRKECG